MNIVWPTKNSAKTYFPFKEAFSGGKTSEKMYLIVMIFLLACPGCGSFRASPQNESVSRPAGLVDKADYPPAFLEFDTRRIPQAPYLPPIEKLQGVTLLESGGSLPNSIGRVVPAEKGGAYFTKKAVEDLKAFREVFNSYRELIPEYFK